MTDKYLHLSRLMIASAAALTLAACDSSGSYRVASVGSVPGDTAAGGDGSGDGSSDGTGSANGSSGGSGSGNGSGSGSGAASGAATSSTGGTSSGGTSSGGTSSGGGATGVPSRLLVTSGNAVLGVASKQAAVTSRLNGVPKSGIVTGTVTTVLTKAGKTVVDLGNGNGMVLNGVGGKVGSVVSIDLGAQKVVQAPGGSGLVGVNVLSPAATAGTLGTVNVASGGQLIQVSVPSAGRLGGVAGGALPATSALPAAGVIGGTVAATGGAVGAATGATGVAATASGAVTTVTGSTGIVAGGSAGATTPAGGTGLGLGLGGALGLKKK